MNKFAKPVNTSRMIKLVVFDWNGTILADTEALMVGVNAQLSIFGLPAVTLKQYREYYDIPIIKIFKHFGITPEQLEARSLEAATAFHEEYEPRVLRTRTRSGTRACLSYLQQGNTSSILLSNHTMENIYLHLERLKLMHYFDTVLANEIMGAAYFKGKQERLEQYLQKEKILPKHTIIVGDTVEEVRIGKKLGIKTVSLTGGYNSTKRLVEVKPDFIIHKLTDLPKIIKMI